MYFITYINESVAELRKAVLLHHVSITMCSLNLVYNCFYYQWQSLHVLAHQSMCAPGFIF